MNGIIPVVIATGNDTRAIESGAHAYAARSGQYSPFATWEKNADGDLVLVFDEYAVAAGYMGMVEFTIPQDVYSALLK